MPQPSTDRPRASWTKVGLATLGGTAGCMLVAVSYNVFAFAPYGPEIAERAAISAAGITAILATPLFLLATIRLRGMALANIRLNRLARMDGLTACLNRDAFVARCTQMLESRAGRSGAMLVIDADNFKAINDTFGHGRGDEALAIIARTIRAAVRGSDLVGRMGGEEFAVYLPDTDPRLLIVLAERIRRAVQIAPFAPDGAPHALSVSIGAASHEGTTSFGTLFHEADQRLYAAKQAGRNRVVTGPLAVGIAA
jgi:diguanylate cyclase